MANIFKRGRAIYTLTNRLRDYAETVDDAYENSNILTKIMLFIMTACLIFFAIANFIALILVAISTLFM